MGVSTGGAPAARAGELLADAIIRFIRVLELPNGLRGVGYGPEQVDGLVAGTLPQHRVTKLSPRPAGEGELRRLFLDSMRLW
jgi:hydroxyacid-oxoacid transhydrogenase